MVNSLYHWFRMKIFVYEKSKEIKNNIINTTSNQNWSLFHINRLRLATPSSKYHCRTHSPFIKCTTLVLDSDSVTALLTTKTSTLIICHTAVTAVIAIHCCNAQASYYTPFCVRRLVRHGSMGNVVRRSIDWQPQTRLKNYNSHNSPRP